MSATTGVRQEPQLQLSGERVIDDRELEAMLVEREQKKTALAAYQKVYRQVHDAVIGRVKGMDLPVGRTRCGAFVIVVADTPARSVSFETQPGQRIRIKAPSRDES